MIRCGDCSNFFVQSANSAANTGLCRAFLDEEGLGEERDIYMDAGKCPKFVVLERVTAILGEYF